MKKTILTLSLSFLFISLFGQQKTYDLIISHAKVLDVKTGNIAANRTILIWKGKIEAVISEGSAKYKARKVINAQGKLVTPGFIDTHIHPTDVFGDYKKAPAFLAKDSLKILRKKLSDEYLPFGTTTVLTMGQPENWLDPLLKWQKYPQADYVDLFIAGGALISKEKRVPYIGHTTVETAEAAKQKVKEYYNKGIKRIKLYYRLQSPEFISAYKTADSLGMGIYGHIGDFSSDYLTINQTLDIGLINYEHVVTIPNAIITSDKDKNLLADQFKERFGELNTEARYLECYLEQFRYIYECKLPELESFINKLVQNKVTFSTTIHRVYEQFQPTYYSKPNDTLLTAAQTKRCLENFGILMECIKIMHDKGIEIRLGSDGPNGGKINISELILLCKYGFSAAEAFKIATINGAKAMKISDQVGTVESGKQANLLIWDEDPFIDYNNFSKKKTVIKDGEVFKKLTI
ncbi:amidohydrolase family protein [Pedobacter foliorum]|uniref:amidohydrolase family protein n=1 Tax=Pedobacter foliorum TaxID=2739058 RepID=UPI0015658522|nr:amidohydrolase family protein [Pedobacter foliorum]NRF38353.1 amidohydrolase family protein [Pedobacter foliorum]